ncbi:hypothetical protein J3F84DRAFT_382731 [Trichoderma pleuroticola]
MKLKTRVSQVLSTSHQTGCYLLPLLTALVQRITPSISPLASGDGLLCSNVAAKSCPWASLDS